MRTWGWGLAALAVASLPWQAEAQVRRANAAAQIATAVYAASATVEAVERRAEARDRQRRGEIAQLQSRLNSARSAGTAAEAEADRLEAELVAAQQRFVADLAERDRGYAQEIAVFRGAVESIASSAEGTDALARFNEGDRAGAIAILDDLRAARDAARQSRVNLESAAEAREIAILARDARSRGDPAFDTAGVIARYQEVIALDPGEFWDWIELVQLYVAAGANPQARAAAERAVALAGDDLDRAIALGFAGQAALAGGDLSAARANWEDSLRLVSRLEQADPQSRALQRRRASTQGLLGGVLLRQGELSEAISIYEASTDTLFDLAIESPTTVLQQELGVGLTRMADAHLAEGAPSAALVALRGALRLYRRQFESEPESVYIQRALAVTLTKTGDAQVALGDATAGRAAFEEAVALFRALSAADPTSVRGHTDLIGGQARLANVLIELADLPQARRLLEDNLAIADLAEVGTSPAMAAFRAETVLRLGIVLARQGDGGALAQLEAAEAALSVLAQASPDNWIVQNQLSSTVAERAAVLTAGGRAGEAEAMWRDRVARLEAMTQASPATGFVGPILAASLRGHGEALVALDRPGEALNRYRESLALLRRTSAASPSLLLNQTDTALTLKRMAEIQKGQGDLAGADLALRDAVDILALIAEGPAGSASLQRERALALAELGTVQLALGDAEQAERLVRQALEVSRAQADPASPPAQLNLIFMYSYLKDVTGDAEALRPALALARELQASGAQIASLPTIIQMIEQALAP